MCAGCRRSDAAPPLKPCPERWRSERPGRDLAVAAIPADRSDRQGVARPWTVSAAQVVLSPHDARVSELRALDPSRSGPRAGTARGYPGPSASPTSIATMPSAATIQTMCGPRGSRRVDREVDRPSREPEPSAEDDPVVAASRELARDEDEGEGRQRLEVVRERPPESPEHPALVRGSSRGPTAQVSSTLAMVTATITARCTRSSTAASTS